MNIKKTLYHTTYSLYMHLVLEEIRKLNIARDYATANIGLDVFHANFQLPRSPEELNILYRKAYSLLSRQTHKNINADRTNMRVAEMFLQVMLACKDLEEVLITAEKYVDALSHDNSSRPSLKLIYKKKHVKLKIDTHRKSKNSSSALSEIKTMHIFHQIFSWLVAKEKTAESIEVGFPRPSGEMYANVFFDTSGVFNSPQSCLIFKNNFLNAPVVRSKSDIPIVLDRLAVGLPVHNQSNNCIGSRVQVMMSHNINRSLAIPTMEQISEMLYMSPSTLKRRLLSEGTSYMRIKMNCQYQSARCLILNTARSVDSIAEQVGFSDSRAFRRAFLGWAGKTPTELRNEAATDVSSLVN